MPIDGFDFKDFSQSLADQAGQVIPEDISPDDSQYIVNIVYNFSYMAGEAIFNDAGLNFTSDQASVVTQFIGEWSFHKSIDLIRSGIDPQFRDGILQKVAFTVFEIAKQAILKEFSQQDMVSIVEHHVKKAYLEALEELKSRGAITEDQIQTAESESNIDAMAQQMEEESYAEEEAQSDPNYASQPPSTLSRMNDNKILKLATLAMVVKRLPQRKQEAVLNKMPAEDAQIVEEYSQMEDLEEKIDPNITMRCLNDIKEHLPPAKKVDTEKLFLRLYKIVKNSDISKISNIISRERSTVKKFVLGAADNKNYELAPRIGEIVCQYLEEKLG